MQGIGLGHRVRSLWSNSAGAKIKYSQPDHFCNMKLFYLCLILFHTWPEQPVQRLWTPSAFKSLESLDVLFHSAFNHQLFISKSFFFFFFFGTVFLPSSQTGCGRGHHHTLVCGLATMVVLRGQTLHLNKKLTNRKMEKKCFWGHNKVMEQLQRQKPKHAKDNTEKEV